jgi:hypothetical protein
MVGTNSLKLQTLILLSGYGKRWRLNSNLRTNEHKVTRLGCYAKNAQ